MLYTASRGVVIRLAMFKLDVAQALIQFEEEEAQEVVTQRGPVLAKRVNVDARYNRVDHFPLNIDSSFAQRCQLEGWNRRCKYNCRKCEVFLYIDRKCDCFNTFQIPSRWHI